MKGVGCRAAHEEEQVMRSVEEFLAYAIALEREARRFSSRTAAHTAAEV
jgi:rubrerythrin